MLAYSLKYTVHCGGEACVTWLHGGRGVQCDHSPHLLAEQEVDHIQEMGPGYKISRLNSD